MARAAGSEWRLFRASAIGCAVVGVALAAFGLFDVGGQTTKRAVIDGSLTVASVFAAFTCFRAARLRAPGRRRPWRLLGAAATCYVIGNTIWFYYQVLAPEKQTYPGPADAFLVAVVPLAIAAMLTLPHRALSSAQRVRAVVDGLIVGAAMLFLSWVLLASIWHQPHENLGGPLLSQLNEASWTYLAVYLYYPLADIVIISVATGLAVRGARGERLPMLLVAAGFVATAYADTGIGYLAIEGRDAAGTGLGLGWTFGCMLIGLAALVPTRVDSPDGDLAESRALVRELLPYVPVGVVLVVAPFAYARRARIEVLAGGTDPSHLADEIIMGLLVAMVALLVVRHMLTLTDNVGMTRHLGDLVRRRTRELEHLTHRHTSILDAAGEGIVGLDQSARLTFANPAAAALLGRSPEELVGRSFNQLTDPHGAGGEATTTDLEPIAGALADGQVRVVTDGTFRRADGTDFSVELTVAPIRETDEVSGGVLMFRDVTERRAMDRMKDEFVSVVSHELRTPLTSLRGALGLLRGGLLDEAPPKAQRMVHIAVESTDRLIRLINDILDVERIASGHLTLHRQAWPAAHLVGRAVAEMRGLAAQAGVEVEIGAVAGTVDADADRIVQTITNLLSNAIKFSPTNGTVRVTAGEQDGEVLFRVSDEGSGIPPDQQEAVFGRFAQVDASDTREKEGTGLGLAICRGIVEQHGGRIWAQGEPGTGATLSFTLPAIGIPSELVTPLGHDRSLPSVLVCEDDPAARAVISDFLSSHGYAVLGAASGEAALSLATEQAPDAVLIDLSLPDMDGWTVIAGLRADDRTHDVPVLIVSGTRPGPAPVEVAAWLTKPLDLAGLLGALADAIAAGGPRPCVLVVEDDPALSEVLAARFAEHGVMAVQAHTARDALRLSRDIAPDLLLLDLLLPDSDGFALVDWLREDPRLCRVPLVVYSVMELDEDERERLRLGPTQFFTKARTNPEEVERQVLELLDVMVTGATP